MSEYSRRALEILRALEGRFRIEINSLHQAIRDLGHPIAEIEGLRSQLEELVAQQQANYNDISTRLKELLALAQRQTVTLSVTYQLPDGSQEPSQGGLIMKITDIQSVTARAAEKDARGNDVSLDTSKLVWSSADPTKITANPQPDGSCTFEAVGPLTADATGNDPGVQVSVSDGNLTQVDNIQVVSSAATSIGLAFDQPTDAGNTPNPPAPPSA